MVEHGGGGVGNCQRESLSLSKIQNQLGVYLARKKQVCTL